MLELIASAVEALSWAEITVLAVAAVLAGFLRGFVGFGGALVVIMVASVIFGPIMAVGISSLSGVSSTIQLLPSAIRLAERRFVVPLVLATFAVAPLGTWVLVVADPEIMKMAISVFVLIAVTMMYRGWRLATPPAWTTLVGAGAVAGLVQGAAGVGGPAAVTVALAQGGEPAQQRANVIGAVTALSICNIPPLWFMGVYTVEVVILGAMTFPLYSGGTWLGARFFSGSGHRIFRNAALIGLAVLGVVTLGIALRDHFAV
ncbi:MAG: sulfite exporter TauE/SafE family protein [Rhodospirillaceae bacterium]|jgi:uncharacterized protein|nr:sulfite exporter TauE/SafE family protein [Rhodospirillaceae bacterium]